MAIKRVLSQFLGRLPPWWIKRIAGWQFAHPLAGRLVRWGSGLFRDQEMTIRYGVGAGLRFNTGRSNPGYALGTTEPHVQEALARLLPPGGTCYDIGANVGFFSVLAARLVGPDGLVCAFEPVPENATLIRHNAALNGFSQVRVIAKAAHAGAGTADLLLAQEPTWARLASLGKAPEGSHGSVSVELVAIDDLVAAGELRPPTLVKIDVEGAEIEVLQGMARTLATHRPVIVCEQHGRYPEFADLLVALGYEIAALDGSDLSAPDNWNAHALATPVLPGPVTR